MTMTEVKQTLPAITGSDGFDASNADQRIIQGTLVRCTDGNWTDRDGLAMSGVRLLALATTSVVQLWQTQRPVETIIKQPDKPLPDVDALNAQIPQNEWESGVDGKPRPPWQR